MTNDVAKPVSKFYAKDRLLTSRSGQKAQEQYEEQKVNETRDLLPKFTPQRSYISVEMLTKSRVVTSPKSPSINYKRGLSHLLLLSQREGVIQTFGGSTTKEWELTGTSNCLGAKLQE